mmetsp:Transcript_11875/g.35049  ORF Transcript_11875/g.35049 Transcript_11875/m.35049 type:complete len:202 (-) Transcript_11875:162-767(-)
MWERRQRHVRRAARRGAAIVPRSWPLWTVHQTAHVPELASPQHQTVHAPTQQRAFRHRRQPPTPLTRTSHEARRRERRGTQREAEAVGRRAGQKQTGAADAETKTQKALARAAAGRQQAEAGAQVGLAVDEHKRLPLGRIHTHATRQVPVRREHASRRRRRRACTGRAPWQAQLHHTPVQDGAPGHANDRPAPWRRRDSTV